MPLRRRWPTGWGGREGEQTSKPTHARGAKVAVLSHFQPRTGRRKLATGFLYHCVSDAASLHRIWMVRLRASCLVRIVTVLANPRASSATPQSSNICVSDLAEKKEIWSKRRPRLRPFGEPRQAAKRGKRTHTMPSVSFNKEGGRTGEGRRRHGVDRGGSLPPSALARSPLGRSVARQNIVWKNESQSQVTQERGRGRDI